jgi:hypothetical protein
MANGIQSERQRASSMRRSKSSEDEGAGHMKLSLCSAALIFAAVIAMAQDRRAVAPSEPVMSTTEMQRAFRPLPLACGQAPVLACGIAQTATTSCLSQSYYVDIFTINAIAGQDLAFQVTTSYVGATMSVVLLDADANVLTSNDAYASVPLNYEVVTSATLYLGIGINQTFAPATYTVKMACSNSTTPPPDNQCVRTGTLSLGSASALGSLSSLTDSHCASSDYYSATYFLDVPADSPIVITYKTAGYKPYMFAETDKHNGGIYRFSETSDDTITMTYLPIAGRSNWLYLESFDKSSQTGAYTISIAPAAIDPCRRRSVSH